MNSILLEIREKYGEWLEMAGDNTPALTIEILSALLKKERDLKEYYKKLLDTGFCNVHISSRK